MVRRKAEIALSAAQVAYVQLAVLVQLFLRVDYVLGKAAYLSEFRLLFVVYPSVFVRHVKRTQEFFLSREKAVLCTVVLFGACDLLAFSDFTFFQESYRAFFRYHNGGVSVCVGKVGFFEALKHFFRVLFYIIRLYIFLRNSALGKGGFGLQNGFSAHGYELSLCLEPLSFFGRMERYAFQ